MQENETMPVRQEGIENGSINYANEVIATIVGMAASEVEGVSALGNPASNRAAKLNPTKNKSATRGVKVEISSEEATADVQLIVEYGLPIQKVCVEVQENVRKAIETMTGLHVVRVDVRVMGVSFEKENKELAKSLENARSDMISAPETAEKAVGESFGEEEAVSEKSVQEEIEVSEEIETDDEDELPETEE